MINMKSAIWAGTLLWFLSGCSFEPEITNLRRILPSESELLIFRNYVGAVVGKDKVIGYVEFVDPYTTLCFRSSNPNPDCERHSTDWGFRYCEEKWDDVCSGLE